MDVREFRIHDYLNVLYKRKRTALAFAGIIFTLVLIATLSATPIYQASTKLIIEKTQQQVLPSQIAFYSVYDPEFYQTQYQLIRSEAVAMKVAEALSADPAFRGQLGAGGWTFAGWLRGLFGPSDKGAGKGGPAAEGGRSQAEVEALAQVISGGISVRPEKDSRIVTISYTSSNPVLASLVANSIAKAYIEQILEMRMSSARYTIDWMKKKADEERGRLGQSEQALQDYIRANDIVTIENRGTVVPQKLSDLSSQLVRAESRLNELEALYGKLRDITDLDEADGIPPLTQEPTLQALRKQVIEAQQDIDELSKKYGAKHPVMIRAREDLGALKEKKAFEAKRIIDSMKNEYDLARANVENTRRQLMDTRGDAMRLNEKLVQYESLKKEAETNRQLFDVLVTKMKEQSLTEQAKTVDVWMLEKAREPRRPIKPNVPQNLLLGFIFSAGAGLGLAFLLEHLDNTVKSPEDAEARLKAPALGMIPLYAEEDAPFEGIVAKEPKSTYAEMYKHIRTAIMLSSADHPPRTILITSVEPKDGKTATAINLALALSQSEKSVLLVDTDLRNPSVHKALNLENKEGLSSYLAGASALSVQTAGGEGAEALHVITAGPVPPNPSELLSSAKMASLIEDMKGRYDIVMFDSTPLLAVTDALILSKMVDGTIVIVRSAKTTYETARKGLKHLQDIKAHVLGLIVNAADMRRQGYYGYKYYYYYSQDRTDSGGDAKAG